jgi:hypothetical protein
VAVAAGRQEREEDILLPATLSMIVVLLRLLR